MNNCAILICVSGLVVFLCMCVLVLKLLKHMLDAPYRHYNHDALNCMFQLTAHGYDDAAAKVYWSLSGVPKNDSSNALLRNMVIRGRVSICFRTFF